MISRWRTKMKLLFCHPGAWSGGFFELALELGSRSDERLRAALCQVWAHPSLNGCYRQRNAEPEAQARVGPTALDLQQHAHGIADIPRIGRTCCLTIVIREKGGPDWLTLGVPMESLSQAVPTGAYPFEDGTDLSWRLPMYAWLRQVAESVFDSVPFQLGLIDCEVSGDTYAEDVRRDGVPTKRWFGYLWPANERLQWYAPTEGAPSSIGGEGT
jgi:hypothetical protein